MKLFTSLITYMARHLIENEESCYALWLRRLGTVSLIGGLGMGTYFLFHLLIPILGYLESGLVISAVFLILGLGLICLKPRKKTDPTKEILLTAKNTLEQINVPMQLEKHGGKLVGGAVLLTLLLLLYTVKKER